MLKIRRVKHLADLLGFTPEELNEIADNADRFCHELILLDPAKPHKARQVLDVRGDLRKAQSRLLRSLFMPKLKPSVFSHGGVKGRHVKTNLECHIASTFALSADITDFYPTISYNRVYRLFSRRFDCTPDVARICTRLCTHQHHLALGLITSPFIADQIMLPIDRRIASACDTAGLVFTRYVDDLTISGPYSFGASGFTSLVRTILGQHGFDMHPDKICQGRLSDDTPITKLTIRNGYPDVRREYLAELERQIDDANNLAKGRAFQGPYYTRNQIFGRVQFVCWINPRRRKKLLKKFRAVPWRSVDVVAQGQGLVASKKQLIRQPSLRLA